MNVDRQLRDDLRAVPIPAALVPPADLADTVLHRVRRQRRTWMALTTVAAVVALAAVGVPLALGSHGGASGAGFEPAAGGQAKPTATAGPAAPGEPTFVAPGGGPQAIHVYGMDDSRTYLLDPAAGKYRKLPYLLSLSPDLRQVAVEDFRGRAGVADRAALLRDGEPAIHWIDVPPGSGLRWSPDGTALVFTSLSKSTGAVRFTAHRYDTATGKIKHTPINIEILGSSVGWAADSTNYVALLKRRETDDGVEPGALQYLRPDGSLGQRIEIQGGTVGGAGSYSPSRKLVIADASDIMSAQPLASKIVDVATRRVVTDLPQGAKPVGWYDEKTVALLTTGSADDSMPELTLMDIATGAVTKRIELPGVPRPGVMQIAASEGLTGEAAKFGF